MATVSKKESYTVEADRSQNFDVGGRVRAALPCVPLEGAGAFLVGWWSESWLTAHTGFRFAFLSFSKRPNARLA